MAVSRREPKDLVEQGLHFAGIDLNDSVAGKRSFCKLINDVPNFDLVILNAGKLGQIRDMKETSLEDLRETMEINVWSNKWLLDCLFADERGIEASCRYFIWRIPIRKSWLERIQPIKVSPKYADQTLRGRALSDAFYITGTGTYRYGHAGLPDKPTPRSTL